MSYKVIREIGRGGFGIVEEVENGSGERLARKRFEPGSHIPKAGYPNLVKRFKREVRTQQELGGQEVIPVLDSDLDATKPWFVMPLAAKTYEVQIAEDRSAGKVTAEALADIMNGLEYLHDLGFVHRDLNPRNVLLHDGTWKLSDLGAVLPPSGQTVTLTEDTIIFTEQYCSPEQRVDFHKAQSPSDIFSFGCILHDLFGSPPRRPYSQQKAPGDIGLLIEKCTEINPKRRPEVSVVREILLENLIDNDRECKVDDREAESWLARLVNIETWSDDDFDDFARFFASIELTERADGHENDWVHSDSTPFLSHLPQDALERIVSRQDGVSESIVDKYCEWAMSTHFAFHYADTVCSRLVAIYNAGTASDKARAIVALIRLGFSHNRWYVMRQMLRCCSPEQMQAEVGRRALIEIRTEGVEGQFKSCVTSTAWERDKLNADVLKLYTKSK